MVTIPSMTIPSMTIPSAVIPADTATDADQEHVSREVGARHE